MADSPRRYAVVTGANRGIGLEICRQLACKGVTVVVTARNKKRGREALEKLKNSGLAHQYLVFHQLDVADPLSIASLADYLKNQFGKIDILVNNAGVSGDKVDEQDALKISSIAGSRQREVAAIWSEVSVQTFEAAGECIRINYHGARRMCEALIPLLKLSESPRIVNVSSALGVLKNVPVEHRGGMLEDENLTEARVDALLSNFLEDFKAGCLQTKGWPKFLPAHTVSKVAMNAYTRILAKKYSDFCINCVCPGFVKTDINFNTGTLTVEEGAATPVKLALLPNGGPSGFFFVNGEATRF